MLEILIRTWRSGCFWRVRGWGRVWGKQAVMKRPFAIAYLDLARVGAASLWLLPWGALAAILLVAFAVPAPALDAADQRLSRRPLNCRCSRIRAPRFARG